MRGGFSVGTRHHGHFYSVSVKGRLFVPAAMALGVARGLREAVATVSGAARARAGG